MRVDRFDTLQKPSRKPWLIIIAVIVAGLVFVFRDDIQSIKSKKPVVPATANVATNAPAKTAVVTNKVGVLKSALPVSDWKKKLEELKQLEAKRKFIDAKKGYLVLLDMVLPDDVRKEVEGRIAKINIDLILNPYAMPEKTEYVVQRGDSVDKIARKFGTTTELIAKSNGLKNAGLIKQGDRFMVFTGKFNIKVNKTKIDMVVYMNDQFFKRYSVCTGKFGKTPSGTFVVSEKIKEPVWWRPDGKAVPFGDPENILGTHWMTLTASGETPAVSGYGIHGTWSPESVGKAESAGCVRMRNEEVEELFTLVPVGTPVVIVE